MSRAAAHDEAAAGSALSTESVGVLALGDDQIQLQVDEQVRSPASMKLYYTYKLC